MNLFSARKADTNPVVGRVQSWRQRAMGKGLVGSLLLFLFLMSGIITCNTSRSELSALEVKADSVLAALSSDPVLQHGYQVYRSYGCVLCHGVNGEGGVKNANAQTAELIPGLTYIAEGYTVPEFQKRVLEGVAIVAKLDSTGSIPPLVMPGWAKMKESELNDLTSYVWDLYPEDEEDDW